MRLQLFEAGPSSGTPILGRPISPTFGRRGSLPLVEEDDCEWEASEDEDVDAASLLEQFPPTPPQVAPESTLVPTRPARSARRSLDAASLAELNDRFSSPPSIQRWSLQQAQAASMASHRYDAGSVGVIPQHQIAPSSPRREERSRVSLDATPVPSAISAFESIPEENQSKLSRTMSREPMEEDERWTGTSYPQRVLRPKRARFVDQDAQVDERAGESDKGRNNARSFVARASDHRTADAYAETFRGPVDETIRSVPGVYGLGEGWAGGPQRKEKKGWLRIRKASAEAEDDPLSLWPLEQEAGSSSTRRSPLREMWNRSKKNLFGASSPALLAQPEGHGASDSRRPHRLLGMLSLSRVNVNETAQTDLKRRATAPSRSRWRSNNATTTQLPSAGNVTVSRRIPTSPSTSILPLAGSASQGQHKLPQYSNAALARSEGDLFRFADTIPQRSSSLRTQKEPSRPDTTRRQGLPPPWRPTSMYASAPLQTLSIPEADEMVRGSSSSTSIETPVTQDSDVQAYPTQSDDHALTRTATFGLDNGVSDQNVDDYTGRAIDLTYSENVTPWSSRQNIGLGRPTIIHLASTSRPGLLERQQSFGKRSMSLFQKMKKALPISLRRNVSDTPSRSTSRTPDSVGPMTPVDPPSRADSPMTEPRMEPLRSETPDIGTNTGLKHARRASWMTRSTSNLAKRLSKLTEQDEVDSAAVKEESRKAKNRLTAQSSTDLLSSARPNGRERVRRLANVGARSSSRAGYSMSASASMPALHHFQHGELDLRPDHGQDELRLEDILDAKKRKDIVTQLCLEDTTIAKTRREVMAATTAVLEGKRGPPTVVAPFAHSAPTIEPLLPKRNGHRKSSSESVTWGQASLPSVTRARRNSMPLDSDLPMRDSPRLFTTSQASTPGSQLVTPRQPSDLTPFLHALTFVEEADPISPPSSIQSKRPSSVYDSRPLLNAPWGASASINGSLNVHRRSSGNTACRKSMDSYVTQSSLFDTDEVVETHAVRVTSILDMRTRAKTVQMDQLGEIGVLQTAT
ncbi:hypothetical protein IAU60_002808 [Kwoniella sp. DSM 27419]